MVLMEILALYEEVRQTFTVRIIGAYRVMQRLDDSDGRTTFLIHELQLVHELLEPVVDHILEGLGAPLAGEDVQIHQAVVDSSRSWPPEMWLSSHDRDLSDDSLSRGFTNAPFSVVDFVDGQFLCIQPLAERHHGLAIDVRYDQSFRTILGQLL